MMSQGLNRGTFLREACMGKIQVTHRPPKTPQFSVYLPEASLITAQLKAGDELEAIPLRQGQILLRKVE